MPRELTDEELIERGRRAVAMDELEMSVGLWQAARAEAEEHKSRIKEKIAWLEEHGGIVETEMAKRLGVDRMTIRGWLGKSGGRRKNTATEGSTGAGIDPLLLS